MSNHDHCGIYSAFCCVHYGFSQEAYKRAVWAAFSLSSVDNLKSISAGLSNWKGNSGTTADEIANNLITQATSFHHDLESVDNFLQTLIISKTEQ